MYPAILCLLTAKRPPENRADASNIATEFREEAQRFCLRGGLCWRGGLSTGTLRSHEDLILKWLEAKKLYSNGAVKGMKLRLNLATSKSYGYRNCEVLKIAVLPNTW